MEAWSGEPDIYGPIIPLYVTLCARFRLFTFSNFVCALKILSRGYIDGLDLSLGHCDTLVGGPSYVSLVAGDAELLHLSSLPTSFCCVSDPSAIPPPDNLQICQLASVSTRRMTRISVLCHRLRPNLPDRKLEHLSLRSRWLHIMFLLSPDSRFSG